MNHGYFIKRKDPTEKKFIESVRDRSMSEVTPEKLRVGCTTGAEIYCYMLSLYGIESNLLKGVNIDENNNKTRGHWLAKVLLEDDTITADGTNAVWDKEGYHLSDMTRLKIGLIPANFVSSRGRVYAEETTPEETGYSYRREVNDIVSLIAKANANKDQDQGISVTEKVEILKEQLMKVNKEDIGNTETLQYVRELFKVLFEKEQDMDSQMIGLSSSLYTEDRKEEYSYYPIIYIRQQDGGYAYYSLDKENGLKSLDAVSIREGIESKRIYVRVGKDGDIPGLYDDPNEKLEHISDTADDRADVNDNERV